MCTIIYESNYTLIFYLCRKNTMIKIAVALIS